MADPAPTGTVVPAPQGGGSPAPEFKVPDGKVLIDASEQQTWQRQREQLAGLTKFQGEAAKVGIKRTEDFGRIAKLNEWLGSAGLTMDQLMQAKAEDERATGQPSGFDPKSMEAWAKEQGFVRSADLDTREKAVMARLEHQKAMDAERALVEKFTAELLGDKPSDWEKRAMSAAVKEALQEKRSLYQPDHPLHGEAWSPYDEKTATPVFEEIKKLRGLSAGEEVKKLGEAANRSARTTPAGGTPQQGRPKEEPAKQQSGSERIRSSVEKFMAGRKGGD